MLSVDRVREEAESRREATIAVRRHLHMHPELSFQEERTAAFVSEQLAKAGIEHRTGVGGHGIVATIAGNLPGGCVALRADMDALPIQEENEFDFRSTTDGVMHACGHDGHTSSLLATGQILHSLRSELKGTVKLFFQPAEERAPGGALGMIAAGALDSPRVDVVYGQHVNPGLAVGTVGFNPGVFMASADEIYVTIVGRGGHAAAPHLGIDPVVATSQIIVALQQVVSRRADPISPSVLTFGRMVAAGAGNVIPDRVELEGTFRALDPDWRDEALDLVRTTIEELAAALGARAEVRIVRGYPAVRNDATLTTRARSLAVEYLGEDKVVDLPPVMWGEDFAYYALERPGCFYNLGVGTDTITSQVHTSRFTIAEESLVTGSGLMAWLAIRTLSGLG